MNLWFEAVDQIRGTRIESFIDRDVPFIKEPQDGLSRCRDHDLARNRISPDTRVKPFARAVRVDIPPPSGIQEERSDRQIEQAQDEDTSVQEEASAPANDSPDQPAAEEEQDAPTEHLPFAAAVSVSATSS